MKTANRKILSFVLALVMIASLIAGSVTFVSAADVKAIDKILVDFRNETDLTLSGGEYYKHTPTAGEPDPLTGGKFSWNKEENAMQLEYHVAQQQIPYHLMFRANKTKLLTDAYKFAAIVFRAQTDETFTVRLSNSPNQGKALVMENVKGSDTYQILKGDISTPDSNGKSILQRWIDSSINTLSFDIKGENAKVFIKEVTFFKSMADLEAYYSAADVTKDPKEYMSDAEKAKYAGAAPTAPAAPSAPAQSTVTTPAAPGTFSVALTPTIEEKNGGASTPAEPEVSSVEPYIMDLSSVAAMNRTQIEWYKHDGKEEGKQKVIANAGEDNSNQLIFSPESSWASYRGMLRFQKPNVVTKDYKWGRITYKIIDDTAGQIKITNNGGAGSMVVVPNTLASNGEWTVSAPFDMTKCQFIDRFVNRMHVTIEYTGTNPDAKVFIKNFMLFGTEKQAYDYVGDTPSDVAHSASYSALTFGNGGTAGFLSGDDYGVYTVNDINKSLDISYAAKTNWKTAYMAKIKFNKASDYDINNIFTRVLYSAKNPEGIESTGLYMYHDANGQTIQLVKDVKNTNGEYVLSEVSCLTDTMPSRFLSAKHCSVVVNTTQPGGEYSIKGIYFFNSREAAESFSLSGGDTKLTINGNDISKYQIVIDKDNIQASLAATALQVRIHDLCGVTLPIVDDTTAVSEYEILVGLSDRELSAKSFDLLQKEEFKSNRALTRLEGNTLVFACQIPKAVVTMIDSFNLSKLYESVANIPESINLDDTVNLDTVVDPFKPYDWGADVNRTNPEVFSDTFDFDRGYFAEENGEDNFEYYNGVYRMKDGVKTGLSYIHVFERDAVFSLDLKYTDASANADMGIMLRYNSADAWVKAGYDVSAGEYYIDSCEGKDFYAQRIASVKAALAPDTFVRLTLSVDETQAKLYVDGVETLSTMRATHTSPGRVAFFGDGLRLTVDNAEFTMLSGEGTIWSDVAHTKLPYNGYIEGGSVYEMNDGSLVYQNHNGKTYKSTDNGTTWEEISPVFPVSGYMNVLKLNDGSFLQIFSEGGYWKSRISTDEGKTWVTGGNICKSKFENTNAGAGNMNDKIMQTASGKLFYGQNYEISDGGNVNGRKVFCEFYYSDDLGKTWIKSETDSWEIEGNEKIVYFGEAKMLECDDGTIRMYNSWSTHGCLVYSESKDGGKTFGPLVRMEDYPSSRSSMQFVRDKWGETDTTYYMVWINNVPIKSDAMPRSRLSLAKSTDGKNWTMLGDVWRWESNYMASGHINHIVDPFVNVTEDYILVGSGFSEHTALPGEPPVSSYHNAQRQHIYAIPKASIVPGEPLGSFTDVDSNDSCYEAVKYAVDNGLFNGTSDTTFAPDTIMSRSMFVTVLGRLAKADTAAYTAPTFTDVVAGQWYTAYVEWAAANGIVNGLGNGIFGINGDITVEQACTILYRYADGKTAEAVSGKNIADYSDSDCISAWAADGVKWAVENGIYNGVGESLSPTCPAPRWLVAEIFANYAKVIK